MIPGFLSFIHVALSLLQLQLCIYLCFKSSIQLLLCALHPALCTGLSIVCFIQCSLGSIGLGVMSRSIIFSHRSLTSQFLPVCTCGPCVGYCLLVFQVSSIHRSVALCHQLLGLFDCIHCSLNCFLLGTSACSCLSLSCFSGCFFCGDFLHLLCNALSGLLSSLVLQLLQSIQFFLFLNAILLSLSFCLFLGSLLCCLICGFLLSLVRGLLLCYSSCLRLFCG